MSDEATTPCPDCGEIAIPCPCEKSISTIAQLQRALEAAGGVNIAMYQRGAKWRVSIKSSVGVFHPSYRVVRGNGCTLSAAISAALDAWGQR